MTWPNEEEAITYMGWWSEDEKKDIPDPWETFTLMVHGREAGDMRNATVEDLRLAGFVQATEPMFTLEEILRLAEAAIYMTAVDRGHGPEPPMVTAEIEQFKGNLHKCLQESRR